MPPLIAPALVALGVSAGVAGPLSSIIFAGLSIALSILFKPDIPKPEAGRIPFKQAVPSRCRIIGRRRNGGAFMLYHSVEGGRFFGVQAICEGPANAFTRVYLHDDIADFGGEFANSEVSSQGNGRYGDDKVRVWSRLGVATETAYETAVSYLDPMWSEDHRGDGIASVLLDVSDPGADDQAKRFPFGLPNLSVEVDATQVFDPREEDQVWSDPSTWSGTGNGNPILQTMWFLTASVEEGGMGLDIEEAFVPVLDAVGLQADICDEFVPRKIGTEPRYTSAVLYHFNDNPSDILGAILGTCDGFCAERGDGSFIIKAGQWDDDDFSVVIEDRHIISLNVRRFRPDEDEVTGVIVTYNSVAHEHTSVDAPVWPRDAYQGGEDRRIRTIEVNYCNSGTQAQRLSKRVAIYEMAPVSGTAVLTMYGILLLEKRGATIQCTDDPELEDCKVRLTRVEPNLVNGTVEIDFTVFDPDECDAWTAASEEGALQPVITPEPAGGFATPADLVAVSYLVGTVNIVDIGFDPVRDPGENDGYYLRWRLADIGGGVPGAWEFKTVSVDRSGGVHLYVVSITGLPAGRFEFQLQAYRHDHSDWSASAFADTRQPAPGRPVNFTAVLTGADVVMNWNAPNSANMDHARVYRAVHGAGFDFASPISGEISGVAKAMMTFTDVTPASGDYDYWVGAENTDDVASIPRGPENVTVP